MTNPIDNHAATPDTWSGMALTHAGDDVFYHVGTTFKAHPDPLVREPIPDPDGTPVGANILVFHWHTPSNGDPSWRLVACSDHTVVDPSIATLTLDPSLSCGEDGCSVHGHIRAGKWEPA
jgi:hypothetical protein